jgi:hypothetical protein
MDSLTSLMTNGIVGTATSAYVSSDDGGEEVGGGGAGGGQLLFQRVHERKPLL